MMRKFFNTGSKLLMLIGIFFIFNSFFIPNISLAAVHDATAVINPTSSLVNQSTTYTYTVTNGGSSTANIGSVEIQLPTDFGDPSINISSASPSRTWELGSTDGYVNGYNSTTRKIGIKADGASSKLDINEFVEIQITTTTPATANLYEWTAYPLANLGFSGTAFIITGSQPSVTITEPAPPTPTETFIIRNGDTVLFNGEVPLPDAGTIDISTHTVDARSVLAVLKSIDDTNDSFEISNLQYFDSYNSFYLKCITPTGGTELCDNWQYAVGSVTPFTSIDTTILTGGETIGIYFGNSHQVVLSSNTITTAESLDATAQKYNYTNNIWEPLTGVNIGVTLPNEADPWNPIIVSTSPVDANGLASITITDPNTYTLGIAEDYYFPSYTVTVSTPVVSSGGGGGSTPTPVFNVQNAIAYLKSVQDVDGSFGGSILYTDWVAVAYGAGSITDSSKDKILAYFNTNNSISGIVTDNERHVMALLALGQNPYDFNGVNYIKSIIDSFDGTQFGDANLINDDIFALIPLANSGYNSSDEIILKDISYIISKQKSDGSWESSIDMTSAGIQALKQFENMAGVTDSINKASSYLQNNQGNDGGWGNVSGTSWAMQAGFAIGTQYIKNNKTGLDYLASTQFTDGGMLTQTETLQNRIWTTSYAIPAGLNKSWSQILQTVQKPVIQNIGGGGDDTKEIKKEEKKEEVKKDVEVKKEEKILEPEKIETPVEIVVEEKLEPKKTVAIAKTIKKEATPIVKEDLNKELLTASVVNSGLKFNVPRLSQWRLVRRIKGVFFGFQGLFRRS